MHCMLLPMKEENLFGAQTVHSPPIAQNLSLETCLDELSDPRVRVRYCLLSLLINSSIQTVK